MLPLLDPIRDNTNDRTVGASFITNTANASLLELRTWFGQYVFNIPHIRKQFILSDTETDDHTQIIWNRSRIKAWLAKIHQLEAHILWLQHMTCGPPKRATEVAPETIVNPNSASLRTLVIHNGLIGNATFYNKVTRLTGKPRCNVPFMDKGTSNIVYVLLVLARPFMVTVAADYYSPDIASDWRTSL